MMNPKPICPKCQTETPEPIRFRTVCSHCGTDLHSCLNCRYYAPGKPNDCAVPGTEYVRDREAANFCEEFKVKFPQDEKKVVEDGKKKFHSLFKEEK